MEVKEKRINLSDVDDINHKILFDAVAKVLAENNLKIVNSSCKEVCPKKSFYTKYGKRMFDLAISFVALIILLPINIIISFITLIDVGRPILFHQKRVGYKERIFIITKFRNMTDKRDKEGELLPPSKRVTKFGLFIRKYSLDELLNFFNVLKGDMSIIGPRPILEEYLDRYNNRHIMRHELRPGLECPMIKETRRNTWLDQFENDIYYIENVSLVLDIKMLFKLVKMVFGNENSISRDNGMRDTFLGYDSQGMTIGSSDVPAEYYNEARDRIKKESYEQR